MRKILQKDDVAKALTTLTAEKGKKPTISALHAALNNRGSLSTLIQLVEEIEMAQHAATEAGDAFNTFRQIWSLAMDEGKKEGEASIKELKAIQYTLCQENERLYGAANSGQERAETVEKEKADLVIVCNQATAKLEKQLNQVQAALIESSDRARQTLEQLLETQNAHADELAGLRIERDTAVEKSHVTELELAVCKAHLESKQTPSAPQ